MKGGTISSGEIGVVTGLYTADGCNVTLSGGTINGLFSFNGIQSNESNINVNNNFIIKSLYQDADTKAAGIRISGGTLNVNGGSITSYGDAIDVYAYETNINISSGTINSLSKNGISNAFADMVLTIGKNGGTLNTSLPSITGYEYGLSCSGALGMSSNTIYFYNGILKGKTAVYSSGTSFTGIRSGATLLSGTSGEYKTAYFNK